MQRELSIYLDIVRFFAAFVIFLGHSADVTGGLFWQLESLQYMYAAVIVFFVLSGYVIGYVANTKEHALSDYISARIARFYSVIIPALFLTLICSYITLNFNGLLSKSITNLTTVENIVRYLATLFNLQHIWTLGLTPSINGPFWSLSYEFFYYCIFASGFYLVGKCRIVCLLFFILLAGPTIIFMFPMWLMGYYTYILHQKKSGILQEKPWAALVSLVALISMLVIAPMFEGNFDINIPMVRRWNILGDYFNAISFTVHLIFIHALIKYIRQLLFYFQSIIQRIASLTFALYLFHAPLLSALTVLYFEPPSAMSSRLISYVGTLFIVATFGGWCEKKKYAIKKLVRPLVHKLFGGSQSTINQE